ncbi:MAG: hypothetical protein AAF720_09750 [Pseudomonadota bacterium]
MKNGRMAQSLRKKVWVALALPLLALSACATSDTLALQEDPAFARGYGDGCTTGQEEELSFSTRRPKDEYEFENSRAYRAGWRQGYLQCQNPVREPDNGGRILGNEREF